jgi:hypothetical protein
LPEKRGGERIAGGGEVVLTEDSRLPEKRGGQRRSLVAASRRQLPGRRRGGSVDGVVGFGASTASGRRGGGGFGAFPPQSGGFSWAFSVQNRATKQPTSVLTYRNPPETEKKLLVRTRPHLILFSGVLQNSRMTET